jgi:Ca-activated chloride channel family protein
MTRTLAVGASFWAVAFVSAEQGRFTSRADLVTVYASVRSRGEPVWTLERGDFEVLVDGKQRDIVHFAREAQPLTVAIVLDRSGSYFTRTSWSSAAAKSFVAGLRPEDRASVGRLERELQSLTGNPTELFAAIDAPERDLTGSPIWSAVTRAIASLETLTGRRAVLMFTDGGDNSMKAPPAAVAQRAQESGITLYAGVVDVPVSFKVSADQFARNNKPDPSRDYVHRLVESTGGRLILAKESELERMFTALTDEMRLQYLLGFQPEAFDGKFHRLRVRVPRHDVEVRAREGYLAVR